MADAEIPVAFKDLFDPQWRDICYHGGRGGAKTHSVGGALVIQAAQAPLRVICAREIQNSIRDSSKQLIEDKINAYGLANRFKITDSEINGINGSRFLFKGMWRNPDAIKSLEGADVFWGDEANRFSERSIRLVRPTMRKPGSRMIWTWNPEFDHDPIDRLFRGENGPPPRSLVKQVGWQDNPYFKASPLFEEMEHDYAIDHARAAHIWGGSYLSAIDGAYYVKQLDQASKDGRISSVSKDPTIRVRTFWDLGRNDATAIWVAQFVGREIRFLDYIEGRGQEMGYYIQQLRARGWDGCLCVLPHDGANVTVTSVYGSAEAILKSAGFEVQVVPNQGKGAALARVEAARRLFPSMWFNADECRPGLKALAAYHERIDDKRNVGLGPMHDWASDPADAFGLAAIAYEAPSTGPKKKHSGRVASWMG